MLCWSEADLVIDMRPSKHCLGSQPWVLYPEAVGPCEIVAVPFGRAHPHFVTTSQTLLKQTLLQSWGDGREPHEKLFSVVPPPPAPPHPPLREVWVLHESFDKVFGLGGYPKDA